ncbi:B30.2/SPRY domain-containing protein [Entamoeba marina]
MSLSEYTPPLLIIIREHLLGKVLSYCDFDDLGNFVKAYPMFSQTQFIKNDLMRHFKLVGNINKAPVIVNREWVDICHHLKENFKFRSFALSTSCNKFGLTIADDVIINTNTSRNRRVSLKCQIPFEKNKGMWICSTSFSQYLVVPPTIFYYEIEILPTPVTHSDQIDKFIVSFGLTQKPTYPEDRHIGWNSGSIGYHSDDGYLFHENGSGKSFGPKFNSGDVVGVGFIPREQVIFFTYNGTIIENRYIKVISDTWYPAIGFSTAYSVQVNFGKRPFAFDLIKEMQQH